MEFGERYTTSEMDEYDKKFAEMQKYIPFLEAMIERLQNVKDKSREVQLQKMQSLHGILSNSKRKLKIETLQRCEDVLQKLHNKVEKFQGNTPGLHFPKKNDAGSTPSSSALEDAKSQQTIEDTKSQQTKEDTKSQQTKEDTKSQQTKEDTIGDHKLHETPASPSPPVSPDSGSQVAPIIIPTERSVDFDHNADSKPASPDPIETLPTKAPIIIPTERTTNDPNLSPTSQRNSCKTTDDVSFTEWDMLEENENQISRGKNWQTIITSTHDMVKMVGGSLPQKVNELRGHMPISPHCSRQMSTVPITSMGGSRRIPLILDKNRLMGVNLDQLSTDSRPESPENVADTRLKSPDTDMLFTKHGKNTSPKVKDPISRPKPKPSAPLLLSPPPVSTEPPLSMEDLAELLNEEGDSKSEKKDDRSREEVAKMKKDKQESNALGSKDSKAVKPFLLTQEDIDSENERRWEEVDKHIVKLTSRKCLPSGPSATLPPKVETTKSSETKGPPQNSLAHSSNSFSASTSIDNRNRPPSPSSKAEPRFADNYERHPRQLRDNHSQDKDKANIHNMHCRPDDDMPNQSSIHHGGHQRRQGNIGPDIVPPRVDTEFRMEGPEYFNRQVPPNQGHWSNIHGPSVNTNDFCNNQWPPNSNFSGVPNSPAQPYQQHPMGMHQEMWNVGSSRDPIHMDPHQMNDGQLRPNQFPANMNAGIRPLMSPNARPQEMNLIPRVDEIPNVEVPNVPTIQPLISPTRFPVGPQYRNFQGENRPYDPSFDRGMEYSHKRPSWDSSASRPNDVPYRPENDVPCGVLGPTEGPSGSYPRASTPCSWNRDRDRNAGRGRGTYYNDRSRGEPRNSFNRDTRRTDRPRDGHNDWDNCNRFNRDGRNISDRDPRVRVEHNVINQSSGQSRDTGTSVRDPRLAKDKHFPASKSKETSFSERDPRKRTAGPPFSATSPFRKAKDKPKSPTKPTDSHRRVEVESNIKQPQEKTAKDKMQSPLESLYGVIDTKAKSAQGYCLQKFKIPKIKRNESSESPSSSHIPEEVKEGPTDKQEPKSNKKEKEDATAEVSSSSDGNGILENWNEGNAVCEKKEELKEETTPAESEEDKTDLNIGESDSISTTSKIPGNAGKSKKDEMEPEGSKSKDEVTQEWIEALIRKSFEFGEGKKFVEQAKFMQKLGEVLQAKKLKKIKKIIESESESSSSDKDGITGTKKVQMRKKRRVIVSDSSDEESLAERLGILNTTKKESSRDIPADDQKEVLKKIVEEKATKLEPSELQEKDFTPRGKTSNSREDLTSSATGSSVPKNEESISNKTDAQVKENISEQSKEELKQELTEEKEVASKTPKVKAKRRNSLEMLQEDIREMFISDDVVAATGHRQCRTQKENQNNSGTNVSHSSIPTAKKDEASKRNMDVDSDTEDALAISSKQKKPAKSRSSEESSKLRGKAKREAQRVTRQRLKQCNQSSDSEEDQPLALRTELAQNSSSLSNQEPSNEDSEILRRSKRIFNKETIKEPRVVVEKTDISKLDCSKVMFDSSSDESFGIDVSELAAAVDISLHPDKQPDPEAAEPTEKKKCSQTSSKKLPRKKGSELMNESKDEQLTDEESITSDLSMSSSVASARKTGTSSSRLETSANEELLSNILVGLVQSKSDVDKDSSMADKGSDADVDDDINDQLPAEANARKSSTKKKKKKFIWQMGILSRKKRKKTGIVSSPKGDSDSLNTSSEMDTSTKMNSSSVSEGTSVAEKIEDSVKENPVPDDTSKDQKIVESPDSTSRKESLSKSSVSEEVSDIKSEKSKEKMNSNVEKVANRNKEEVDKAFYDLDIKQLIDYAWTGQERYKCLLCFFTGKSIVHHYKLSHPGKEILISRLKVSDAQLAVKDAKQKDVENTSLKPLPEGIFEFHCRFCTFFTEGDAKVAMEAFYEHCTTHTGEYRFRCNSCPYQAVAKSSMRTHYYKVCRKFKDTFAEAITEDEISDESGIYGYLCSNCNYVQLKRNNVEDHVQLWHEDDSSVKIIKINMSRDPAEEESDEEFNAPEEKLEEEVVDVKTAKAETVNDRITSTEQTADNVTEIEVVKNSKPSNNEDKKIVNAAKAKPQKQDLPKPEMDSNEKKKSPQTDTDSSPLSGNLSAFVCPPELEKKEVEIQLERKRKMQEIIQNIGIKLQKDASKKGLSITDKLKDKMKTNIEAVSNETDSNAISNPLSEIDNDSTNDSPNLIPSQVNITELPSTSTAPPVECSEMIPLPIQETSDDKHSQGSIAKSQPSTIESDSQSTTEENKMDAKVKDPLSTLGQNKNDESDVEVSDNENLRNTAPVYDSDSSSEQSDGELSTDVNMILKETSNINATSKNPMLTTIQRLAAQLQATKPLDTCKDVLPKPEKPKRAFPLGPIPKPPDVVPITSIKRFIGKKENKFLEISQDALDDGNQPKNFIRLRRLSGDMLSVPMNEEITTSKSIDASQLSSADKMDSVLKADEEEGCSFLKIENVVSLAPSADNDGSESPIITDIRKAVEISPMKGRGVSVLKKSHSPLILKRLNPMTIAQPSVKNVQTIQPATETVKLIPVKSLSPVPVSVTTTQIGTNFIPIAPKSKIIQIENKLSFPLSTSKSAVMTPVNTRTVSVTASSPPTNLNYKILKVVRTPTILKPKEPASPPAAVKFKSADAYSAMLKASRLIHLYKCMARDCRYTTDVLNQYHQHYLQHVSEAEKKKLTPPFDCQNCAYCYTVLDDWNQMKLHIEEKHAHCRYQCIYCFYRAVAPSYVQIHQTIHHPNHYGILLGKLVKDVPLNEDVDRRDCVHPYVCQHDCGKFFYVPESFIAHLKSKHKSCLSAYKCHVCRTTYPKIEQLLTHYKTHGFYKYQCLYCINGSDTFTDMHNHLSTFHCNRLPQVLERTLPPQPVRNKDVIEQLLLRTLDDSVKTAEEIIDVENDGKDKEILVDVVSQSIVQKILHPQLPKEATMVNKEDIESLNKSISTLFGTNNTSNSSLSVNLQSEKSLNESCNDNATDKIFRDLNDSEISVTSASNKKSPERSILDISKGTSILADRSSSEPFGQLEGSFDCSDEFININILDNPDFLKKVSNRIVDVSVLDTSTGKNENKTEDSDIEIVDIDDTEIIPSKNIKSEINRKDSIDGNEKIQADQESDSKGEHTFNDDENSSTSTDSKKTCNSSTKIDKPMTLEDIKDTGFAGTKLYKCGNEKCDYRGQNAVLLRIHLKDCTLRGDDTHFTCAHCNKRFMKIGFLLEHLKSHGLKRFGCSMCKMRCTVGYQAMAHMKAKHRYAYSKLVPADPKNPSVDGLFIVQPVRQNVDRKGKKRKSGAKASERDGEKMAIDIEKFNFSPDEIDSLPRQAIYNREVQCAVCPYTTKVRMNIIRHLQMHAKDETVPESGPVNPVPCLDKKERMFDKMVNLASSSHQNGRMGGKPKEISKENDDEFIPKFIPEHKRYVCGVAECNYLTVDEAMLRCHLKALHSEEQYFRCPHCPQPPPGQEGLNIAIDKMGVHLKMHDTRLYKCSHCNHHHYHRHVVERHLSDKHAEKRPFVKVIRELENTENNQQPAQEEIEEEVPDPDGNHWKCNICDYKCVYKAEMVNHTTVTHDEKCQYKCTSCSFKTSGKIMFEQHMNGKHPNDPTVDYILIYQRIKGVNKKTTETVEQGVQEEPFDTTPLWRRDMPRIRHIRGILLEEEDEVSSESSLKTGKRKSDLELQSSKPAKIKPGKSGSLDDSKQIKDKSKRSLSCDKVSTEVSNVNDTVPNTESKPTEIKSKETKGKPVEDVDFNESDVGRFGQYGKPDGNMYVCTLCNQFKTKYKHDMRDHLYRELNYARWHCKECGYLSVNRNGLLKHFNKHHNGERPNHEPLSPDNDIEEWVGTLLKRQTLMIKGLLAKQNVTNAESSKTASASGTDAKPSPNKVTQNASGKPPKATNVADKTSSPKDDKSENVIIVAATRYESIKGNETQTADAKDSKALTIETPVKFADAGKAGPDEDPDKPFVCKHCKMTFTRWRGFKLHIQLTHLKRLGFICPYCDRSTNSEGLMRQHIRSKHSGCAEKIVENPAAGGPELPEEFWQQEYGIVFPKRSKKRKRKTSGEDIGEKDQFQIEPQEKCNMCNFTAMNTTGLKIHMRIHATKTAFKCSHCSFTAPTNTEVWEHWELTHPLSPFKVEEISMPESSGESADVQIEEQQDKTITDDYSNDIEEERVAEVKEKESIYYCFYCSFRSKSVDAVQSHWSVVHSESSSMDDSIKVKLNYPFKYKEIQVSSENSLLKPQCSNAEAESSYEFYLQQSHSDAQEMEIAGSRQEGWICQWCNELCDTEVKMKTHHSMFHSHLPLNFKKQDKNKMSKGYICPDCSFTTTFINVMKNHVLKHINLFKCKYCEKTFSCPANVSSHNVEEHPGMELKIESIQNYEALLEKIMAKVRWQKSGQSTDTNEVPPEPPIKVNAVAKKSTAKNAFRPNIIPYRVKAVARKSTNPHSRYLTSTKPSDKQVTKSNGFSYYGIPRGPVNLAKLNTYMVVGGHRMKVNCTTLAQLININPTIVLKDLKHDIKSLATLQKLK